jgi:hypothetical protein
MDNGRFAMFMHWRTTVISAKCLAHRLPAAAVVWVGLLAGGCCMMAGGALGLYTMRFPVSFRVVDERTGEPIADAQLQLRWQTSPHHRSAGKPVAATTDAAGWATFGSVPAIGWHGDVLREKPFVNVYVSRLFASADGYRPRTLRSLRHYSAGMRDLTIPLRRDGETDGRTIPVEIEVVYDSDGTPVEGAKVALRSTWRRRGVEWCEEIAGETGEDGRAQFHWTPPSGFQDAQSCWNSPQEQFDLEAIAYANLKTPGTFMDRIQTNSVVLRVDRYWADELKNRKKHLP